MRIAREAWPFVLPCLVPGLAFLVAGLVAGSSRNVGIGGVLVALSIATALFFRDPSRRFDGAEDILLAPADGKILAVDEVEAEFADGERRQRIVTFLSVFDVHIQRSPVSGEVVAARTRRGAKLAAFNPKAGEVNEQRLTVIRTARGELVGVVQIAGLVARRVVGYLSAGDRVERGGHLGLIKFGSRVDLVVPPGYIIEVRPGDRVVAGETPMARPDDAAR